jgi:hypothetical protein
VCTGQGAKYDAAHSLSNSVCVLLAAPVQNVGEWSEAWVPLLPFILNFDLQKFKKIRRNLELKTRSSGNN